jgi:hypothetical protein
MARFSDADSPSEQAGARFGGTGLGIPSPIPAGPKTGSLFAKRDPGQLTLMALMQRQKELAAQRGEGQQPVASWTQGLSNALHQTYEGFQAGRNEKRIGEANDIQAAALAAADPKTGLLPEDALDSLGGVNPELLYKALQDISAKTEADRQYQLQLDTLDVARQKAGVEGSWKPSDIGGLRDDYTKAAATYEASVPAWTSMQNSFTRSYGKTGPGVGAADYDMIVGLAKILDPGSVVREGETETIRSTGGAADYLISYLAPLRDGGSLSDDVRKGLMMTGQSRMKAHYGQAKKNYDWVSGIATRHQVDPNDVLPPLPEFIDWKAPEAPDAGGGGGGGGDVDPATLPAIPSGDVDAFRLLPEGSDYTVPGEVDEDGKPVVFTKRTR